MDDARQSGANIAYTYDSLKRLTKATTASWTQNIGYDGFGNITAKDAPAGSAEPTFPGAVSSKNWLTGVSYDINGNALAVNAFALTYDVENRLATATSGLAMESYSYDESNHRVEKTFGSSDYIYFYGPGGRLLSIRAVTNGTTSVVADRVYFGGLLLGSAGNGPSYDVSTMTDRLGTALTGYPYGTDIGTTTASNDQPDFATYTRDATTGFEYANQRYYSAGFGRFLTADPSSRNVNYGNPTSWDRFTYVNGDPVNGSDPTGRCDVYIGGINSSYSTSGTYGPPGLGTVSFNQLASTDGADIVYPYSNYSDNSSTIQKFGNTLANIAQITANTFGTLSNAYAVVLGLESASEDDEPINIVAFSGGAQAFTRGPSSG